ncbi:MAG: LamG-like jellyroll fold domain-containing protein [Terriglobales bacterium]
MRTEVPTRSTAVTACFWFVVVIILLAGLWPFQFRPPNQVNQDRENGLVFGKRGIAYARDLNWRSTQPAGFTMETWLKSAGPVTSHLANVVCLTRTSSCSEFLLSQWRSEPLLVARFSDANGTSRQRKMGVADALPAGRWAYVVITSGTDGMQMYVNGQLR